MTSREDLLKIPKDLMLKQLLFTVLVWFVSSIRNITAFFLQNGKDAISNGQIILGLLFIVLYYVKEPVMKFLDSSIMIRHQVNQNHIKKSAEKRSIEVLLEVEENVSYLNPQTRCFEKMEASTITETIREYLSKTWERSFWLLDSIATLLSSTIVIVGLCKVARAELEQLTFFVVLILFSCMSYAYDVFKKHKLGKKHSKNTVFTRNSQKKMYQNLLNVIPLNDEHAKFLQSNYLNAAEETFEVKKEMRKENKFLDLLTTSSETVYTVFLLLIVLAGKGINAVNLEMILTMISIAGIYKRFTIVLGEIAGKIATRMNLNNDIAAEAENFELIMTAYDSKYKKKQNVVKEIVSIEIYPFKEHHASDERQKKYELWCQENISLYPGDFVILTGPTGAGKSTLMNMITFNRDLAKDCVKVVPETDKYPKTVMQRAKQSLGRQSVLEELTFGNDGYDRKKLCELLHAMNLYEEIAEKTSDVLFYLAHASKEKFSRGQIQRLVLVRTLLNMEDDVSVVALDEATSNLNDELAIKVMEYVKDFCKSKIVLFATHQASLLESLANKHLKISNTDVEKSYCLTQVR